MALDKPATAALLRDAVRFASDLMGGAPALWAQEHRAKDNVPPADAGRSLLRLSLARVFSPETVATELAHAPVFPSAQPAAQNAVASLPQSNLQSGTRWEPVQTKSAATPRTPSEEAADLPQQPKLPAAPKRQVSARRFASLNTADVQIKRRAGGIEIPKARRSLCYGGKTLLLGHDAFTEELLVVRHALRNR